MKFDPVWGYCGQQAMLDPEWGRRKPSLAMLDPEWGRRRPSLAMLDPEWGRPSQQAMLDRKPKDH
jgi:hypothetical protein